MTSDLNTPITSLGMGQSEDSADTHLCPKNALSYVSGPAAPPLLHKTIPQLLDQAVRDYGYRTAVVFEEQAVRWRYDYLKEQVDKFAAGLLALGLQKGERVGIWSPNCVEWIVMQYASARIGLILVNINPAYRLSELEYALNKVGVKALLLATHFKTSDYLDMISQLAPELAHCEAGKLQASRVPQLRYVIRMGKEASAGMLNYDDILALAGPSWFYQLDSLSDGLDPDDPINIQFTSGTTGAPKGATLTHKNIINNARNVVGRLNLSSQDALCIPVPLYHCFGMVMGSLGCVSVGATMVFPGAGFAPKDTLAAIASEKCTALYGVPTMFVAMLEDPDFASFDLSSLRTGIMAGAPCPIEVMKQVMSDMHMKEVTIAYGMTETSPVSFQSHLDDPLDKRVTTVGRIHPHVDVKIIDEKGEICAVGEKGELCTKGYSVMQGYWDDDEKTKQSIDSAGWMHTGDLAIIDELGYCAIVGRLKDMIIRGGENIYPREIEEFLFQHPNIKEVQVFGVPDKKFGEEICAWIILHDDTSLSAEDVTAFCDGQIAHQKIPRYVRFVDNLPMTISGKPQKFVMRDEMIAEFEKSPS